MNDFQKLTNMLPDKRKPLRFSEGFVLQNDIFNKWNTMVAVPEHFRRLQVDFRKVQELNAGRSLQDVINATKSISTVSNMNLLTVQSVQRVLESTKFNIPNIHQNISHSVTALSDALQSFNDISSVTRNAQNIINSVSLITPATQATKSYLETMQSLQSLQDSWRRSFKTKLKNLDESNQSHRENQYELVTLAQKRQWFLYEELIEQYLEEQSESQVTDLNEELVVDYVSHHLDECITDIINSPCYATQKKVIEQSFHAYSIGHYETAIFPLFGAFDNVISRWATGLLTNPYEHQKVYITSFRIILKRNIRDKAELVENIQSINLLKVLTVINAYIDLFDNNPSNSAKINRNAILHGSFNYELLTKESYMKMIVLLKSALVLLEVSPSELDINISK